MINEDRSKVNENIEISLRKLFCNPRYVTVDPFKCMIQNLRRKERIISEPKCDEAPFPANTIRSITSRTIPMVKFGASAAVGMKHLAKLVGVPDVQRLCSVMAILKECLGDFPTIMQSSGTKAFFIETASAKSCFAATIAFARPHVLESTVEAVVETKSLDNALTVFIRRIVEEGIEADKSLYVASAQIRVIMSSRNNSVQIFRVQDISARRQQVLSIMKAAVVDGGEIYLELYLFVSRVLPIFANSPETTAGFVKVTRKYHFSFNDISAADNVDPAALGICSEGNCRCFAKLPFDPLAKSIFFDIKEAKIYRQIYEAHVERMAVDDSKDPRERPLDNSLIMMSKEAIKCFREGELVLAAEWMVLLTALLTPAEVLPTNLIKKIAHLLSFSTGLLRAVRDVFEVLESVISTIIDSIQQHTELLQTYYGSIKDKDRRQMFKDSSYDADGHVLFPKDCPIDKENRRIIEVLHALFQYIPSFITEARHCLFAALGNSNSCEAFYVQNCIVRQALRLFSEFDMVTPVIPTDPLKLSKKGLLGVQGALEDLLEPSQRICAYLHMLEVSIATDVLMELFEQDNGIVIARDGTSDPSAGKRKKKSEFSPAIPINMIPLNVLEILGFMYFLDGKEKLTSVMTWQAIRISDTVLVNLATSKTFLPLSQRASKRSMALNANLKVPVAPELGTTALASTAPAAPVTTFEDIAVLFLQDPNVRSSVFDWNGSDLMWNVVQHLSDNMILRAGGVDLRTAILDEMYRYEIPNFLCADAVRLRYLMETQLFYALQDAIVELQFRPKIGTSYSVLCEILFKYSSKLQLFRHRDELLSHYIFSAFSLSNVLLGSTWTKPCKLLVEGVSRKDAARNMAGRLKPLGLATITEGAEENSVGSLNVDSILFTTAGFFGLASVLYGVGGLALPPDYCNPAVPYTSADSKAFFEKIQSRPDLFYASSRLFTRIWSIPPYIARPGGNLPGMKLAVYSGLSVQTVLKWSWFWNSSSSRFLSSFASQKEKQVRGKKKVYDGKNAFDQYTGTMGGNSNSFDGTKESKVKDYIHNCLSDDDDDEFIIDDEEEAVEEKSGGGWLNSLVGSTSKNKDKKQRAPKDMGPPGYFSSPFNDVGVLDYPGDVEIEVVYKSTYEHPKAASTVRSMFCNEVLRTANALLKSPLWRVFDFVVDIPNIANDTTHVSDLHHEWYTSKRFPISNDETINAALVKALSKQCCGVLHTAVALSDLLQDDCSDAAVADAAEGPTSSGKYPTVKKMVTLEKILMSLRETAIESYTASGEANDPLASDVDRIYIDNPAMQRIFRLEEDSKLNTVRCFVPVKLKFSLLGVCARTYRYGRRSDLNRHIPTKKKETPKKEKVETVQVEYDMNGRKSVVSRSGAKLTASNNEDELLKYLPRGIFNAEKGKKKEVKQETVPDAKGGNRYIPIAPPDFIGMLSIGGNVQLSVVNDGNLASATSGVIAHSFCNYARLMASTIWFSVEATTGVWDCLRNLVPNLASGSNSAYENELGTQHDADFCCNVEATRHWKLFCEYTTREDYVTAYEHAAVYALLTNQPQYAAVLCKMLNSLPAQLRKSIQCISMVMDILSRDNVSSVNISYLGHTIARHICLAIRLCLTSPRCVHLNAGGYCILRLLEQLEGILGISPIPLSEAGYQHTLPKDLPMPLNASNEKSLTGENVIRQKMSLPKTILNALSVLSDIKQYCSVLQECLAKDVHLNCYPLMLDLFQHVGDKNYRFISPNIVCHTYASTSESKDLPCYYDNGNVKVKIVRNNTNSGYVNIPDGSGVGQSMTKVKVGNPFQPLYELTAFGRQYMKMKTNLPPPDVTDVVMSTNAYQDNDFSTDMNALDSEEEEEQLSNAEESDENSYFVRRLDRRAILRHKNRGYNDLDSEPDETARSDVSRYTARNRESLDEIVEEKATLASSVEVDEVPDAAKLSWLQQQKLVSGDANKRTDDEKDRELKNFLTGVSAMKEANDAKAKELREQQAREKEEKEKALKSPPPKSRMPGKWRAAVKAVNAFAPPKAKKISPMKSSDELEEVEAGWGSMESDEVDSVPVTTRVTKKASAPSVLKNMRSKQNVVNAEHSDNESVDLGTMESIRKFAQSKKNKSSEALTHDTARKSGSSQILKRAGASAFQNAASEVVTSNTFLKKGQGRRKIEPLGDEFTGDDSLKVLETLASGKLKNK